MSTQAQQPKFMSQLTVFSPAKVNLFLRITGKRADGYHELETVMLPLDFGDQLVLQLRKTSITLECDNPNLPVDDTNLALRAAKLLAEAAGVEKGVKISLQKRTPLAAGLGGGSSNAAAVLMGMNRLWKTELPAGKLNELAARMGSDINFFLAAGAAICRGRGEIVEPVECKLSAAVLLVNPGFGISTKWAYENWSAMAGTLTGKPPEVSLLVRALAEDDLAALGRCLYNSLEAPSVRKYPVLRLLKETMTGHGAAGVLMSGSGATVFGLFADAHAAKAAGSQICEQFGPSMWTQVAHFARKFSPATKNERGTAR